MKRILLAQIGQPLLFHTMLIPALPSPATPALLPVPVPIPAPALTLVPVPIPAPASMPIPAPVPPVFPPKAWNLVMVRIGLACYFQPYTLLPNNTPTPANTHKCCTQGVETAGGKGTPTDNYMHSSFFFPQKRDWKCPSV
jgi:hypothetical protein